MNRTSYILESSIYLGCGLRLLPSLFPEITSLALTIEVLAMVTEPGGTVVRRDRAALAAISDWRSFRHAEIRTENWERWQ